MVQTSSLLQAEEFHRLLCAFLSHLSELEKSVTVGTLLEEEEEEAMAEGQSLLKVWGGRGDPTALPLKGLHPSPSPLEWGGWPHREVLMALPSAGRSCSGVCSASSCSWTASPLWARRS